MKTFAISILFVAAATCNEASALNKCIDSSGKVTIQDTPCAASQTGQKISLPPSATISPPPGQSPYAKDIQRFKREEALEKLRIQRDAEVESAIHQKRVLVGMTEDELIRAKGRPTHINASSGGFDQWVYGGGLYVYLERGVVKSFQERR